MVDQTMLPQLVIKKNRMVGEMETENLELYVIAESSQVARKQMAWLLERVSEVKK